MCMADYQGAGLPPAGRGGIRSHGRPSGELDRLDCPPSGAVRALTSRVTPDASSSSAIASIFVTKSES
jgi:hypothetical protein